MSVDSIMEATRVGLAYERLRMEAASRNIAASNVALPANATATRATVGVFSGHLGGDMQARLLDGSAPTRAVHDPAHPLADVEGMVRYPATDMVVEMTSLMTASRGYEANVRAFNLLRGMVAKAFEIGAK